MSNPIAPVPLDARLKNSLQDFVVNEIERGIRQNFDAVADPASFIASNTPAPANLEFSRSMVRRVCRAWARGKTPVQGPLADMTYRPICTPYLDTLNETPFFGEIGPGFTGGQCAGTNYAIDYAVTLNGNQITSGFPSGRYGPIGREIISLGPTSWGVRIYFRNSIGQPQTGVIANLFNVAAKPVWSRFNIVVISGADNCGDRAPQYIAPSTRPNLPSLTGQPVTLPGFGDVPLTVDFDNDGNIVATFPTLGLTVSVPNPLLPLDTGGGEETPPGEQGTAGTPVDSADGEAEGENPTRNLVGVKVEILNVPPRANTQFNQQSVYYKGAYYVYMGGAAGMSQHPAAIVKTTQFYYADKGSNSWRVEANSGYTLRATPYYED